MSQVSVYVTTPQGRSSWRALRPLLVLGGFVAVWWALMTGVAQAESTHHDLVGTVRSQVKAHHDSPARDLARRVHREVKASTTRVTQPVRQQAKPVTRALHTAPVTPVVAEVTKTIRTSVSDTTEKTRSLLANTAAGPVIDTAEGALTNAVEKAESSIGQGNSPSSRPSTKAPRGISVDPLSSTSGLQSATSAATDQALASTNADEPANGPRVPLPVHDPCTSPSGSSSISITPVGITESSLLVMPRVLRDLHTGRLARLPGGPAYQPGSSPD